MRFFSCQLSEEDTILRCSELENKMELVVTGLRGQQNSLLYHSPPCPVQNVLFFQGDTQVSVVKFQKKKSLIGNKELKLLALPPAGLEEQDGEPV